MNSGMSLLFSKMIGTLAVVLVVSAFIGVSDKPGLVLGGMEGMKYKEHSMKLEKGDIMCLYTDGVTEAEDAKHTLFGNDRLLACCENRSDDTAEEIIRNIKNSVDVFIDGNSQFDDMTMLCFKWK